jgi:hypothetical protein
MKSLYVCATLLVATPIVAPASAADDHYPADQTMVLECPNMPDKIFLHVVIRNKKFSYFEYKHIGQRFDKKNQMSFPIWRKIKQLPNDQFRFDSTPNYVVYYHDIKCKFIEGE